MGAAKLFCRRGAKQKIWELTHAPLMGRESGAVDMTEINFDTTRHEMVTMSAIADRAAGALRMAGAVVEKHHVMMDITATHCNGCRLRLDELLGADNLNFSHDICGIYRHLDRGTGRLGGCFVPRFAVHQGGDDAHA